jgi:hypothetical protein
MTSIVLASLLCVIPPARPQAALSPSSEAAPAPPLTDEEIQQRIESLLGTIDSRIGAGEWRALGPRGTALLERIAQDARMLPSKRALAVGGLSAIGAPSSSAVLLDLARSEQAPLPVRLGAVHGMPRVVSAQQLGTALKPVLEGAKNAHVRRAAAEVLSRNGGCSLVRAQAQREDDAVRMQRALERCNNQ